MINKKAGEIPLFSVFRVAFLCCIFVSRVNNRVSYVIKNTVFSPVACDDAIKNRRVNAHFCVKHQQAAVFLLCRRRGSNLFPCFLYLSFSPVSIYFSRFFSVIERIVLHFVLHKTRKVLIY